MKVWKFEFNFEYYIKFQSNFIFFFFNYVVLKTYLIEKVKP